MKKLSKWLVAGVAVVMGLSMTALTACDGADGKSAYEIAVENGFEGTESEWLESLKGANGSNGSNGTGENGKDGNVWFTGNGLPVASNTEGAKAGDFYINLNTNTIYRYGDDGWSLLFNVSEYKNVSVWDGTIPGWQAPYLSDEQVIANRPASYVVDEAKHTVDIYNAEAFAWFAYRSVIGKTGFKDYTVSLHCDIDLNNKMWVPIGLGARSNAPGVVFEGTFDGNGHTIYNLNSDAFYNNIEYGEYTVHTSATETTTESGFYVPYDNGTVQAEIPVLVNDDNEFTYGLFANVRNATIKNINVANVNINMPLKTFESDTVKIIPDSVGTLVGFAMGNLTLENCTVGTNGAEDKIEVVGCVGGLIGRCYAGTGVNTETGDVTGRVEPYGSINLINCTNNVSVKTLSGNKNDEKAGGIIGYPHMFGNLNVVECVNTGSVYAYYAGGLVGNRQGTKGTTVSPVLFSDCVNYGAVSGNIAGGLIGRRYVEADGSNAPFVINRCVNYGTITGLFANGYESELYAGGFVGSFIIASARGVINDCYNYGDVVVEIETTRQINAAGFIGKLKILKVNNSIQGSINFGCINLGNVTVVNSTSNAVKNAYAFFYAPETQGLNLGELLPLIYFFNNGTVTLNGSVVIDDTNVNLL